MKKLINIIFLSLIVIAYSSFMPFDCIAIPKEFNIYANINISDGFIVSGSTDGININMVASGNFYNINKSTSWNPKLWICNNDDCSANIYYNNAPGYQNAQCLVNGILRMSLENFSLSTDSSNPTQIVCTAEPIPEPEPEFTLSMAVPDKVDLSILPTAEGKLGSESFDITVSTDNPTGYTLSMYNESSDLVNDTASAIIPTLDDEIAKVDFPVNRWGYSLDDVIYKPILEDAKTVLKTTEIPNDEDITTFNLATKINTEKPAGSYTNTFVFNAVANQSIFTVTWDANGGTVSPSTSDVEYDTAIGTLPTPTYDGYNFLGWFTEAEGGEEITAETKVTADVAYFAHWEEAGPKLINFTIDGEPYQAEEGMTWKDWIDSNYNTDQKFMALIGMEESDGGIGYSISGSLCMTNLEYNLLIHFFNRGTVAILDEPLPIGYPSTQAIYQFSLTNISDKAYTTYQHTYSPSPCF